MKTSWIKNLSGLAVLSLVSTSTSGQAPVIASFSQNGTLVCTNLLAGTTSSVEWASSVLGPWTNTWAGLDSVTADANGAIRVRVPMFYRVRAFSAPSNMVYIPAGTFTMGSPPDEPMRQSNEGPQTQVTISRGFWMGKYEVTQGEYLAVMGSNPSSFTGHLSRPVETVSWNDALAYCIGLTTQEHSTKRLAEEWEYRLPTEAEWEYACRAGTTNSFSFGDDPQLAELGNFAWYAENSGAQTHLVGSKGSNAWGLYDMHGNVWEWCQDWYGLYSGGSATDPQGSLTGLYRVLRGGNWRGNGWLCRSAYRGNNGPALRYDYIGFRVVLAPRHP